MRMHEVTDGDWKEAVRHLDDVIHLYESSRNMPDPYLDVNVDFTLQLHLLPLKRRYAAGERTYSLYDQMINAK